MDYKNQMIHGEPDPGNQNTKSIKASWVRLARNGNIQSAQGLVMFGGR